MSDYLNRALAQTKYDKLEDGTFFGRILSRKGVFSILIFPKNILINR
ncbi:MAG TPA: hypothetical protein VK892_19090 [Pyrinomonadaceae bacterium]|nr:hypothetical protein [Pyrinomonadaceae bacterium]